MLMKSSTLTPIRLLINCGGTIAVQSIRQLLNCRVGTRRENMMSNSSYVLPRVSGTLKNDQTSPSADKAPKKNPIFPRKSASSGLIISKQKSGLLHLFSDDKVLSTYMESRWSSLYRAVLVQPWPALLSWIAIS